VRAAAGEAGMKIYWIRFLVFILVLTVLTAGNLYNALAVSRLDVKPDVLLIAMVFFAVQCATPEAIATSFIIGFAADIAGAAMGPHMIAFGLLGSLMSQLQRVVLMKRSPQHVLKVVLGNALYSGAVAPVAWLVFNAAAIWVGYYPQRYRRMSYR
jgi:rod shape-determining protein MreD